MHVLSKLLLVLLLSQAGTALENSDQQRSDDEIVVEKALLAFFAEPPAGQEDWRPSEWRKGDFIAIRPEWSKARGNFHNLLDALVNRFQDDVKLKAFSRIPTDDTIDGPDDPLRLIQLRLDPRIALTRTSKDYRDPKQTIEVKGGKGGTIRLSASIFPPCYCRDGRRAMVILRGASYGNLGAYIAMFLTKTDQDWSFHSAIWTIEH